MSPRHLSGWLLGMAVLGFAGLLVSRTQNTHVVTFDPPIDALSVTLSSKDAQATVRGFDGQWSDPQALGVEDEQDPTLLESNLVLFDRPVSRITLEGTKPTALHPIRLSQEPVHYQVAATIAPSTPKILTRTQWGADETLRVSTSTSSSHTEEIGDNGEMSSANVSQRQQDCNQAYVDWPEEFTTTRGPTTDTHGQKLRWPLTYSPSVKLLVVHHTAIAATGDARSGLERMRALYAYHAANRGWGDIGYQYVIDDQGHIFEGRAGGDYVVGGHAYCNNVGTIGIAMMGNFEVEKPPQVQMQSLQWLLKNLADRYGIDPARSVRFHGKTLTPIVGHRDLLKTDCPGEYVWHTLDQVRTHVASNDVNALITFPVLQTNASSVSSVSAPSIKQGLSALGETTIEGRPGGEVALLLILRAGTKTITKGARIAVLRRSQANLAVWQDVNAIFVPVRRDITATDALAARQSVVMRLKVRLPAERGTYRLDVGDVSFTLNSSGKRIGRQTVSTPQTYVPNSVPTQTLPTRSSSSSRAPASAGASIRIRLTDNSLGSNQATLQLPSGSLINGQMVSGPVTLSIKNGGCSLQKNASTLASGIVRVDPGSDLVTITSWQKQMHTYRGIVECRVVDGVLTLINELPMESYLQGLAEEPDSEPYEKQRAFAIAARTYATYYLDQSHRKFPGKPYDGSDSPDVFQKYSGAGFETQNPRWLDAVRSTANHILTYQNHIIRPPYFSSDTGKTRTPLEAGWKDFPFAEIYGSKADPWCAGLSLSGHGVGMSGCGAKGQAKEGKKAEEILRYYYPGTEIVNR